MQKMRLLLSLIIVALTMGGMVGITGAFFSSEAKSIQNLFSSGSMEIVLADLNQTRSAILSHSWEGTTLLPGSIIPEQSIVIRNNSNVHADHYDLIFSYTGSGDLAKNIILTDANSGFRYGVSPEDFESVNLITGLKGGDDVDYDIQKGSDGSQIGNIDGADGTTRDNRISLSELAAAGKIRIQKAEDSDGMRANSEATLWLNAMVDQNLTAQNANIEVTITIGLDQDASQL